MCDVEEDTASKDDKFTSKENGNVSTEVLKSIPDNALMTAENADDDKVSEGGDDASDSERHSSDEEPLALSDSDSEEDGLPAAPSSGQVEESDEEEDDDDGEPTELIPMPPAIQLKTSGYISVKDLYANHEQNLQLIETVKPITFLYDVGGGKFSKQLTEEMRKRWEIVGRKMRSSADDCRILWTHLKGEFRAKLKCYEETSSETYRKWPYYKYLEFLTPYIHKHRRVGATPKTVKARQTPLKVKLKLGRGRSKSEKSTPASSSVPLPKRSRALPAKLQDYVSNDYMSQIEMAQKLQSKTTASDSDSSSSSGSSSGRSSQAGDQEAVESSDQESMHNGGISERVKRKRDRRDESEAGSDTDEKDAIYVTELSIDGIPTVVIESAVTLSEQEQEQILKAAAATGSTVAPGVGADGTPMHRVSLKLGSPSKFDEEEPGTEGRGRQKYQYTGVPSTTPRKRGRPRKTQSPTDIQQSPELKQIKLEQYSDDESVDEEKNLVVTISDRTNVNRVHCQRISYREAKRINLKGFNVDEWMGLIDVVASPVDEGDS